MNNYKKIENTAFEYKKISVSFEYGTKTDKNDDLNKVFVLAEKTMYQNKLLKKSQL